MTVEWFGESIFRATQVIAHHSEKESAKRLAADAISNCPKGEWERGITKRGGVAKSWTARKPGALRESIRVEKSHFKDGGYFVMAGNDDVFYAHFVELGVPANDIPKKEFLRGAAKRESKRFWKELKRIF